MDVERLASSRLLRGIGGTVAVFSLVAGIFLLFISTGGCSFLTAFLLLISVFLFIGGGLAFLIGHIRSLRAQRPGLA